ncbi:MAG: Yip1 family protein [Eudoraea sp.]|nr:Yip1 family protein [Eudoraea sp.]
MQKEINPSEEHESLTDKEIFTQIWTSPRKVFKYINDNQYDQYVYLLLALAGITNGFNRAVDRDLGDTMSLWGIIGMSVILGGLLGWISYYIYAGLISITGKWLKGIGNTSSLLRAFSYALIPTVLALLIVFVQISVYGRELFKSDGDLTSAGLIPNLVFYGSFVIELILGIWTLVLFVVAVSEVQKFSIGKSILNMLIPIILIAVPIGLIILAFSSV